MADGSAAQELTLSCKAEFGEYVLSEEGTCWALVTTQAPAYVEDSNSRAPLDLVAVVDKSGSMDGDKIRMVRETLKFVVNQSTYVHFSRFLSPSFFSPSRLTATRLYFQRPPTAPCFDLEGKWQ